jgi:hypothetical protein
VKEGLGLRGVTDVILVVFPREIHVLGKEAFARTDVALLQAAAADPAGDLSLNHGGNVATRRGLEWLDA